MDQSPTTQLPARPSLDWTTYSPMHWEYAVEHSNQHHYQLSRQIANSHH